MKLKTIFFVQAIAMIFFTISTLSASAQGGEFPATYYSADKISSILSAKECVGVRFYNVVMPENNAVLTTLAIGIKADSSEIYNILNADRKYQVNLGIVAGRDAYDPTSKNNARELCVVVARTMTSFSASFTKIELQTAITYTGATGLQVSLSSAGTNNTFSITSATLSGGKVTLPTNGARYTCAEPCPSQCGNPSHYINQ